jgi:serine/threonine-protein kinase
MTLAAGKRLGSYEILALIGVGGMGEVYKARDTRLERTVAIKILPDHVAQDADFRQRFEREARAISSLNHPHICTLYDVGSDNGVEFLVMELLEGETLAQRLAKGALPLPQVLRYGIEIAEALDRAHRQGVTHRDLKPGNVMVTKAGAKLLDFGLAKLRHVSPVQLSSVPATARDPFTSSGTILGTLQYMAPEQVEGNPADHRADIFAFGAIVYEMATGKRAFEGASQASLIGAILKDEPRPISTLQPLSPPGFDALIATCLAKDPDERWQSAADVARQLRLLQTGLSQPSLPLSVAGAASERRSRRPWSLALGAFALGLVLAGASAYYVLRPTPPAVRPVTRMSVPVAIRSNLPLVSISADGKRVGFLNGDSALIQVRDLDEFEARSIAGTEDAAFPPCFSPDGQWIAYSSTSGAELKKMPLTGAAPLTLVEAVAGVDNCDWGEDGYIYFGAGLGISRVPEDGGAVEVVAEPDIPRGDQTLERPQLLPGARQLLFSVLTTEGLDATRAVVVDLDTRERKELLNIGTGYAAYAAATVDRGYLIYASGGALFAAPFDVTDLAVGAARPVTNDAIGLFSGVSASRTGTIAYVSGDAGIGADDSELVWVGRDGVEQRLPEPPRGYGDLHISPDGRQVALNVFDVPTLSLDLWVYDFDDERLTKLTFGGGNVSGLWTPDGRRIIYTGSDSIAALGAGNGELRHLAADQSAAPATLLGGSGRFVPTSISRDGTVLAGSHGLFGARDVAVLSLNDPSLTGSEGASSEPRSFLATRFDESEPMVSPDGRYIAYTSTESGRAEIYVVPYPGPGGKSQVSRGGGSLSRWNRNGRELFYVSASNELMAVDVETANGFRASAPRRLFAMPPFVPGRGAPYDVAADGSRFLVRKSVTGEIRRGELRVVINWIDELEGSGSAAPAR